MPTSDTTSHRKAIVILISAAGLTILLGAGLLLREHAPGNMGNGFLAGASVASIVALVMIWRATRATSGATTFERAWTSRGDERDDAVLTRALAVLGLLALPLTGVATAAIAVGAEVPMVLFLLMVAQFMTGTIAFGVVLRRN